MRTYDACRWSLGGTTQHPMLSVKGASGGQAWIRSAYHGCDSGSSTIAQRFFLQRTNANGVTPTNRGEKESTRSPTAVATGNTWGTPPTVAGNPLVQIASGDRRDMHRTWRPARPYAGIVLTDVEEIAQDTNGGTNNSNVINIGWIEDPPDIGRTIRRRSRKQYYYWASHNASAALPGTLPFKGLVQNWCSYIPVVTRDPVNQTALFAGGEGPLTVSPSLLDQSGIVFAMDRVNQTVVAGLIDQAGVTFTPQINLKIFMDLIDQAGITFSPQVNQQVVVGLISQAGVTFAPQVNQQAAVSFIDQMGVVFAPTQITQKALPGFIDQAGVTFAPVIAGAGASSVVPDLIDQSGVVFSPQINTTLVLELINQAGIVFSPQVNMSLTPGLIDQSGVVFTPTRIFESKLYPSLIDQSGITFMPVIQGGVQPAPSVGGFIKKMRRRLEKSIKGD